MIARDVVLACITTVTGRGGIAYVASLVQATLDNRPEITINPKMLGKVSWIERAKFAARLIRLSICDRPDLIVFDHLSLASVQQLLPPFLRRPYAVFLYDDEAWGDLSPFRLRTLSKAASRITLSNYTRDRVFAKHPGIGPIDICTPGLHEPDWEENREDSALLPMIDHLSVVMVARMDSAETHKGHDELIEAWQSVYASIPNAKLLIIGSGSGADRLKAKAEASTAGSSIRFLGFLAEHDMQAVLRKSTVFVMPSRREGFGLVFLEAMRAGLPCVAGSQDASPETVVHNETGIIVDPRSAPAIAAALIALLRDPELAKSMGQSGQRRFDNNYRFNHFKARLGAILDDV